MKVVLTLDGGFSKVIFENTKEGVGWFLQGFQYSRKQKLVSPEATAILTEMGSLGKHPMYELWSKGAASAMDNKVGKLSLEGSE